MSADVTQLLARMRDDFLQGLPERCDRLEDCVLNLERGTADAFDELYRQVHNLKGSGGTFGLSLLTTICHQFESFISEVGADFDQQASNFSLDYLDLLRRSVSVIGQESALAGVIEKELEQLRVATMKNRVSLLLVEPSASIRKLCMMALSPLSARLVSLDRGLLALKALLYDPFDLLVVSRELSDLNAIALVAAVRESGGRNRNIPVILLSSNPAPAPTHLNILATIRRDPKLAQTLVHHAEAALFP